MTQGGQVVPVLWDTGTKKVFIADNDDVPVLTSNSKGTGLVSGGINVLQQNGLAPKNVANIDLSLTSSLPAWMTLTRVSTKTYIGSDGLIKTAASGAPAFEYNSQGIPIGLSIEPAATNICLYSQDYTAAAWVNGGVTITDGQVAPDGNSTASLVTETNTSPNVKQTVSITAGQLVTRSLFLKRGNTDWVKVSLSDATTYQNGVTAWFNVATGQKGSVIPCPWGSATVVPTDWGSHIENIGNGWYRCFVYGIIPSSTSVSVSTVCVEDDADLYVSTVGHTLYQWGEQITAGTTPDFSSYIPTTSASVTRNADVVKGTITNYDRGGAIVIGYQRKHPSVTSLDQVVAQLDDGTTNNLIRVSDFYDSTAVKYVQKVETVVAGGSAQSSSLYPIGKTKSTVLVSSANYNTVVSSNGRSSVDYYCSSPSVKLTRITLGSTDTGSRHFCGNISSLKLLSDHQNITSAKGVTNSTAWSPVNPNATEEAASLYRYLKGIEGQTVFGHQYKAIREVGGSWQIANAVNYPTGGNEQVVSRLLTQSGYSDDYPVMIGMSDQLWAPVGFSGVSEVLDPNRTETTTKVIDWFRQGRIISILTDMPNFVGPTEQWPQGSQTMSAGADGDLGSKTPYGEDASMCGRRIAPGGDLNWKLTRYLQSLCDVLNTLQVDGIKIPIVLRLFREARMGVFWWNIYNPAPDGDQYVPDATFIATYRYAINFIQTQCPQVLFNFCMAAPYLPAYPSGFDQSWYTSVYPGDNVIDFVTIDPYDDGGSPGGSLDSRWITKALQASKYLAEKGGKPFAYSEVGFKYSAQNWSAASATAKGYSTASGYANPNSFWDGICLEQMKRQGTLPVFTLWWGEAWSPYYGCATTASAVSFLRSPQVILASEVTRKEIYGV